MVAVKQGSIGRLGEVALIRRLTKHLPRSASVLVGVGDDAAALRSGPSGDHVLFASDMLVEGVHFDRARVKPEAVGWKALACNVSDIAAMGGRPRAAVVSLGLPPQTSVAFVERLYAGLRRCARRFKMSIVGGDTVRAPVVTVDVAILGTVEPTRLVRRSGAKVGDCVFVTGRLGGSLTSGRHARFLPRVQEARRLGQRVRLHAMMDVSDGLASDLWQLARASFVTFRVWAEQIPVADAARGCCRPRCRCRTWPGESAVWHAVMDGEDFELLLAVSPQQAVRVPVSIGRVPVTKIGCVTMRGAGVEMVHGDGRVRALTPEGFQHF